MLCEMASDKKPKAGPRVRPGEAYDERKTPTPDTVSTQETPVPQSYTKRSCVVEGSSGCQNQGKKARDKELSSDISTQSGR